MDKKYLKEVLMVAVFMCLAVGSGHANEEGQGQFKEKMKQKWEEKMDKIHQELGLTPEQKAKLKAHREGYRSQKKATFEQIKNKKEQITQELQRVNVDEQKIRQLHAELKALKSTAEDARLEGILEVRKILTADQFVKFHELKEKHKKSGMMGKFKDRKKDAEASSVEKE